MSEIDESQIDTDRLTVPHGDRVILEKKYEKLEARFDQAGIDRQNEIARWRIEVLEPIRRYARVARTLAVIAATLAVVAAVLGIVALAIR